MCYSAQIWADFRKYERLGGTLDIKGYTALAGWTRKKSSWRTYNPLAHIWLVASGGAFEEY